MSSPLRNQPCPCGSGKRYKQCCGAHLREWSSTPLPPDAPLGTVMLAALAAQRAGRHAEAEEMYRRALVIAPSDPDALHSLGLVRFERGDFKEARSLVMRALDLTDWQYPVFRQNLGLILGKLAEGRDDPPELAARRLDYLRWNRERQRPRDKTNPLVSVVVPSYNHARYIGRALRSVFAQTYRNVELIVIDDGSRDESADIIRGLLAQCPFPHQFLARANRGSVATVREGLELAHGAFVNVLHSDDEYAPDRFEICVERIADSGCDWGFSAVEFIDAEDRVLTASDHAIAGQLLRKIERVPHEASTGLALLTTNVSITTGNLFIRRAFMDEIGGLRIYKYNDDWEFCLRATLASEPVFLPENLFRYRYHGRNTITSAGEGSRIEAIEIMAEFMDQVLHDREWSNPFAPVPRVWGLAFHSTLMRGGLGNLVSDPTMRRLAEDFAAA
jgi:glycosyltransferase involved in cell wall biosynthesis